MIALLLFLTWAEVWQKLTRATSSYAATARGVSQYAKGKFNEAAASFAEADSIGKSPDTSYNLGTAQIANGNREQGSTTLAKALADPKLRADALFNRGNSALASNAFDPAIRDYAEVLRMRPGDAQAKRNLEIALRRKQEQQQLLGDGKQQNPNGAPQQQQQQKQANRAPAPGDKQTNQPKGQTDADALLRAVQQQEQEELSRMRRGRPEPARVGW